MHLPGALNSPVDFVAGPLRTFVDNLRASHILLAQLSDTVKVFFFLNSVCDLCLCIKRGSKNKRKLEQPVSSQHISNTLFHGVGCCLFIPF